MAVVHVIVVVEAVTIVIPVGALGNGEIGAGPQEGILVVPFLAVHVSDVDQRPAGKTATMVVGHGVDGEPAVSLDDCSGVVWSLVHATIASWTGAWAVLLVAYSTGYISADGCWVGYGLMGVCAVLQEEHRQKGRE